MSSASLEKRALKVSAVSGLSTLLSIAFQLISVPVCLRFWGADVYGNWLALLSAFMLIRSFDAGYIGYVGNKLNYLYHYDKRRLRMHLASAVTGVVIIGVFQLILVTTISLSTSFGNFLGLSVIAESQPALPLLAMIGSWALTGSYIGILHRLMIPSGLMYQAAWWTMAIQIGQFSAVMIATVLKLGILHTSLLFALAQSAIYVGSALYLKKKLPEYYPWWKGGNIPTGLQDLAKSMILATSNFVQQFSNNGLVLLVAALGGTVAVPIFTTVRTIANLWGNITNVLSSPLLPEVVRFHATAQPQKLLEVNKVYWVVVGSMVNFGVLLSYPLIAPLFGYWTLNIVNLDQPLLCCLLSAVCIKNAAAVMDMHLYGINRMGIGLITALLRGTCGIGLGYTGYQYIGLTGLGMGIFIGEISAGIVTCYYFFKSEIIEKNVNIKISLFGPVLLGIGSVIIYLVSSGFALASEAWTWPVTFVCVAISTIWGWTDITASTKERLKTILKSRFNK